MPVRRVTSIAMALMLVLGFVAGLSAPRAFAQETATAGVAVAIADSAGQPMLEISIDSYTPDFQGYDSSYAPDRGFEYALITVTITNVSAGPAAINTYGFQLIDTEGFTADSTYIYLDEAAAPAIFDGTPLEAGESRTGSVIFQVLSGTEAAAITYSVTYDRLTFLASSAANPAVGDQANILDSNAQPIGAVTVEEWIDPLPDTDPSSQASRGYHYGGALVTIENIGDSTLSIDPYSFAMVDSEGYRNGSTTAYRPDPETPDLEYSDLAPGDSVTGIVSFQVFNSSTPAFLVHEANDQFAILASFADGPALPALSDLPTVDAVFSGSDVGDEGTDGEGTDEGTDDVEVSAECQEVEDWVQALFAELEENEELNSFNIDDAANMTVDELEDVRDAFEDLQDDLEDRDAPELADGFLTEYTSLIDYMINALDDLIDAAENGDDLQPIVDELNADEEAFEGYLAAINSIVEACPNMDF